MVHFIKRHRITAIILIYAIYVSLGIPDSLLGVAWPSVQADFIVPTYYGSIIMSIIAILAAIASMSYSYIEKKIDIGNIVVLSCMLTAIGLLIMGLSSSFKMLCIASIPLGIGAGAVDSALNNFVSEKLSSKHMLWLHGSWGIGAIIGPSIYSMLQSNGYAWQYSALIIAIIQIILTLLLFIYKNKWTKEKIDRAEILTLKMKCKKYDAFLRIIILFVFSGFDVGINLWMATYLQNQLCLAPEITGLLMALFYISVMFSRFFLGILSEKIILSRIITYGLFTSLFGIIIMNLTSNIILLVIAICLIGVGVCTVYPLMMFENHTLYEKNNAQKIISYQIAVYLIGSLILPFVIGIVITYYSTQYYIFIQLGLLIITLFLRLYINRRNTYYNTTSNK